MSGLTSIQKCLHRLSNREWQTYRQITNTGAQSSLNWSVNCPKLLEQGLIESSRHGKNPQQVFYRITEKGLIAMNFRNPAAAIRPKLPQQGANVRGPTTLRGGANLTIYEVMQ